MLEIRILGSPIILQAGQPLELARRKSRALLYYLAAQGETRRDALVSLLWTDLPRPAALQNLRTTLHGLKRALGPALQLEGDSVGLSADTWVDLTEFSTRLEAPTPAMAELSAALALYRGELLQDFSLPDAQAYEDWLVLTRERLRRLVLRGWLALSALHERNQDYRPALEALEQALALNPWQEDVQRDVIRLLFLAGDRPGAIQRYDQLRRLLDDEMGVPPMAETRRLYDAILSDNPPPELLRPRGAAGRQAPGAERVGGVERAGAGSRRTPAPSAAAPEAPAPPAPLLPFLGRQAEQALVQRALQPGRLLLIEGEPGIGKTRLAQESMRSLPGLALVGHGRDLESHLSYHPLIEALRGVLRSPQHLACLQTELAPVWQAEVARLLPELAPAAPQAARPAEEARLWEGVRQMLHCLARHAPLLLLLDDLHWADTSTLGLLGYLARGSADAPLLLLATTRPVTARSPLAALLTALTREARLERLPLARLAYSDVQQAAQALQAENWHSLADWLWRVSEGNPYILGELARSLRSGRLPELPDGPFVPPTVFSLIQSRLADLDEAARRLLDAGVAAGREFDFAVASQAAGLSEMTALDALDALLEAGLAAPLPDGRFAFDHPLTMEVAYQEVGPARHHLLHRRVAEAIERLHPDRLQELAGTLAWHFAEGQTQARAAHYARLAAEQAARLAGWNEAIDFYTLALKGTPVTERLPLLLGLAEAQSNAGHFPQASDVLRQVLAWMDLHPAAPGQRERAALALANNLIPQARFAEVIELAQSICRQEDPRSAMSAELVWGTALSLEGADLQAADSHLQAAEDLWQRFHRPGPEDMSLLAHIRFERGGVAAQQGDLTGAVALYRQALADAEAAGEAASASEAAAASAQPGDATLTQRILALNNLGYHLHLLHDASAADYAQRGLALAQERGVLGVQTYLHSTLGEIALAADDLFMAEQHFKAGLALAERFNVAERTAGITANLGRVAARRGETSRAIHLLSMALSQADSLGTQHLAAQVRLWLAPLLPPEEAQRRLDEARYIATQSGRQGLLDALDEV